MAAVSSPTIKTMTYNVNYSRSVDGENASSENKIYSWENRKSAVFKTIEGQDPDVAFLQEVHRSNIAAFKEHFGLLYDLFDSQVNSRGGICSNVTMVKKSFRKDVKRDTFEHDFSGICKSAEKVSGVVIDNLRLINVHFPMDTDGRMAMAENFSRCIGSEELCIFGGDFNSFIDDGGQKQLETIAHNTGATRVTDTALSKKNQDLVASQSFRPYPYDSYNKMPTEKLNELARLRFENRPFGKLDHIYAKGFEVTEDPLVLNDHKIKVEGVRFSPSDHFPIVAYLRVQDYSGKA